MNLEERNQPPPDNLGSRPDHLDKKSAKPHEKFLQLKVVKFVP